MYRIFIKSKVLLHQNMYRIYFKLNQMYFSKKYVQNIFKIKCTAIKLPYHVSLQLRISGLDHFSQLPSTGEWQRVSAEKHSHECIILDMLKLK
jgi:hypothetical protein